MGARSPSPVPNPPLSAEVDARNAELLRRCALVLGAAAVVCLVAATVAAGAFGLSGALIGTLMVVAFFGVDVVVLRATRYTPPIQVLAVVVMVYALKITLLAIFLVALRGTEAFSVRAFGATVIVLTLVALGAAVVLVAKRQVPLITPEIEPEVEAEVGRGSDGGPPSPRTPGSVPPASVET